MSFQIKNNFSAGKVDTDSAKEYVSPDSMVLAENVDLFNQGENFVVIPSKGNVKEISAVENKPKTFLGSCERGHKTWLFYARENNNMSMIVEYDAKSGNDEIVIDYEGDEIGFPKYTDPDLDTYVLSAECVDDKYLYWTWGVRQADGSLEGYGEPKRINIADAKSDPLYSNFSGNYDRPEKLTLSSGTSSSVKVNRLKFGSYIFWKRYHTKYDERTLLSYPSNCMSIHEGYGAGNQDNYIIINGFVVSDDIVKVEILMSNDSSNTFKIIETIDTTMDKNVNPALFYNNNEYPILEGVASDVVNNNYPFSATELTLAGNRIVVADVETELRHEDENGNPLDKTIPFNYTTNGLVNSGLNSDFTYNAGVVFFDDKSRHAGATNITRISYTGSEFVFDVKPNMSSSGITAPHWATKYMFVRDKVNTQLSYGVLGEKTASVLKTGYDYYPVNIPYYNNYIFDERGRVISIYSKDLEEGLEVQVLTTEDIDGETISDTADEYIYIKNTITPTDGTVILYAPSKSIDSSSEVLYETSDVFNITNGNFDGDTVTYLRWYDTIKGKWDRYSGGTHGWVDIPVMKTDTISNLDVNHLGRGAYTFYEESEISGNATVMASEPYTPEVNFNGLSNIGFAYGNHLDLERKYGAIENLFFDNTNLLVGQRRKMSLIHLNKALISSASGTGVLKASADFFNEPVVSYAGDYGITDKRSFSSFGSRRYFVDADRGAICRLSTDGITVINSSREEEIVELCKNHYPQNPIVGGFDVNKMEYIAAFHGSNTILRFSEKSKESVGNYVLQTMPYKYITLDTEIYSSTQSENDSFWRENVGLGGGTFYGNDEVKKIAYVANLEPNIVKDYISMSINGILQSNDTLSSGTCTVDVTVSTNKNTTTLSIEDFKRREGVWYADFMQDENSDGASIFGVGTVDSVDSVTEITLKSSPNNIRVGGSIYADASYIGNVKSVSGKTITFESNISYTPSQGEFIHTQRDSKIEGESIKGNTAVITIEINDDYNRSFEDDIRIFSVTTNVNLSSNTE